LVKFGDTDLPVVQNIVRRRRRILDTQRIVGASVGAKRDGGGFGREYKIQGVLAGPNIEAKMLEIMALSGQAKKLDLEDYTTPTLCIMLTPRFRKQSEKPARYFYELPFVQIESVKQRWLWDSAIISEILSGYLRPELRTLSDSAIVTEILAWIGNYTAPLSDGPVISEVLAGYLRPEIRSLQDSPQVGEALSYETELWAVRNLHDSMLPTEILNGFLLPETRTLTDTPTIGELLNGFLRPEIRALSDYPTTSEILSGELVPLIQLEERWLYDYPAITDILSGMLIYKTPVNAYLTPRRRQPSPSYSYQAQNASLKEASSPSYGYAASRVNRPILRPDPPVPLNVYWFLDAISPSYEYVVPTQVYVRVCRVTVTS